MVAKATLRLKFLIVKFRRKKKKKRFWLDFFASIADRSFVYSAVLLDALARNLLTLLLVLAHAAIHNYKLLYTVPFNRVW